LVIVEKSVNFRSKFWTSSLKRSSTPAPEWDEMDFTPSLNAKTSVAWTAYWMGLRLHRQRIPVCVLVMLVEDPILHILRRESLTAELPDGNQHQPSGLVMPGRHQISDINPARQLHYLY
jgi:hypothetical protein